MESLTLLKSYPTWVGIRWGRTDRLRRVEPLGSLTEAVSRGALGPAPVERVIIEGPLDSAFFLRLLSGIGPQITIDILLIPGPQRGVLSTVNKEGQRILIILDAHQIGAYLDQHALREGSAIRNFEPFGGERLRVMVAEDERKTREFVVTALEAIGCETHVAAGGLEAIRIAQQSRPHVLLLDGLMPEMHGFEVARFVRNMDPNYHPRVVIATGIYKDARYQNEARLKYGVDHYLVKPVTREHIAQAVFGGLS